MMSVQRRAGSDQFLSLRLISVIICLAVFFVRIARAPANIDVVYHWCGPVVMTLVSEVSQAVYDTMEDLKRYTARNNNNHHVRKRYISPEGLKTCFGHATCKRRLSANDCEDCLRAAKVKIFAICGFKISGRIKLQDCFMRYRCETPGE